MTAAATGPTGGPWLSAQFSSAPLSARSREARGDLYPFGSELLSLHPLQMSECYFTEVSNLT